MNHLNCYERLHAGEGPRGRKVEVFAAYSPQNAACEAADYFAGDDDLSVGIRDGHDHQDGTLRHIEVETPSGPQFFRVRCEVRRHYRAEPTEPPR